MIFWSVLAFVCALWLGGFLTSRSWWCAGVSSFRIALAVRVLITVLLRGFAICLLWIRVGDCGLVWFRWCCGVDVILLLLVLVLLRCLAIAYCCGCGFVVWWVWCCGLLLYFGYYCFRFGWFVVIRVGC